MNLQMITHTDWNAGTCSWSNFISSPNISSFVGHGLMEPWSPAWIISWSFPKRMIACGLHTHTRARTFFIIHTFLFNPLFRKRRVKAPRHYLLAASPTQLSVRYCCNRSNTSRTSLKKNLQHGICKLFMCVLSLVRGPASHGKSLHFCWLHYWNIHASASRRKHNQSSTLIQVVQLLPINCW